MKKLALSIAILLLLVGGLATPAKAGIIEDLQAQITQLVAQLNALLGRQDTTAWCHTFNTNFGVGYGGGDLNSASSQKAEDVRSLRTALINEGILGASNLSNGNSMSGGISFDEQYTSAVVKFQAKYGILQTGYVGPLTRAKLNVLYRCGVIPPTACVGEGQSLGAVVPGNTKTCCSGLVQQLPDSNIVGTRGICVRPNSQDPVITGVSGPTSLRVDQTGTWTVNATAPANSQLSYSVGWGDRVFYPMVANSAIATPVQNSATFSHSYSQAGTYTMDFTVTSDNGIRCFAAPCPTGGTAKATMTINVIGEPIATKLSIAYPADPANWHDFVGEPFSKTFTVVNSSSYRNYTWSVSSGSLPSGLGFVSPRVLCSQTICLAGQTCPRCPGGSDQLVISGTPTQAGNFPFTLSVRDDLGNIGTLSLNIKIESFDPVAAKPVIYLYPTKTQAVKVQLDYAGRLIADYPAYDKKIGGWEVIASPDGKLINEADGQEYSYIFWEGSDQALTNYDLSTGFVVKGEDSRSFLQDTLSKMGLTPKEYNEFIVYWYPRMKDNTYNLVHFAGQEYTDKAKLTISPTPDSLLRVFMVLKPLDREIAVLPQEIVAFTRKGFAVVEWGGTELPK